MSGKTHSSLTDTIYQDFLEKKDNISNNRIRPDDTDFFEALSQDDADMSKTPEGRQIIAHGSAREKFSAKPSANAPDLCACVILDSEKPYGFFPIDVGRHQEGNLRAIRRSVEEPCRPAAVCRTIAGKERTKKLEKVFPMRYA
jgi:hypothetical protein